jgi:hypothetical protein
MKRAILAVVICFSTLATVANSQDKWPDQVKSGEAGYKIGCSTTIAVNPCSRVCWELWSEWQKREIEERCAKQEASTGGGGGKATPGRADSTEPGRVQQQEKPNGSLNKFGGGLNGQFGGGLNELNGRPTTDSPAVSDRDRKDGAKSDQ